MSDLGEKKIRVEYTGSVLPNNLAEFGCSVKSGSHRSIFSAKIQLFKIHVKKYCPDYGKFEFYCKKSSVCSLCVRTERSLSHQCKNAFEKYYLFVPNFCCTLTHDKYLRYVTCNLLIFVSDYSIYISRNT